MKEYSTTTEEVIKTYEKLIKGIEAEATNSLEERAYGGIVRAEKGKLTEYIAHSLVFIAWKELGGAPDRLEINKTKIPIPLKKSYLNKIKDEEIKKHITQQIKTYNYKLSVDKHIYIDKKFVMGIECKSYAENAMLKRILVDFDLLITEHKISCYLLQLESQLGGDYSLFKEISFGSKPTHSIMSYFNCNLTIITLLEGERKINLPIHKHFKKLENKTLEKAKNLFKADLKQYC